MLFPRRQLLATLAIGIAASCLLMGYEFVRSVSTSLYIGYYGSRNLPWVMAAAPVATIAIVYAYGLLLSVAGARRALLYSSLASALVIAACYLGLQRHIAFASAALYVFREAYIVVLVEQYWSFINSTVRSDQARLVNGPITGFGSVGAIVGAELVRRLAGSLGSESLLLLAGVSLIPAAALSYAAYMWGSEPQPAAAEAHGAQGHLALRLFTGNRVLLYLAGLVLVTQAVSTVLDLRFSGLVEAAYAAKDARTAYLGGFYATVNKVAFVLQFLIVPGLLRVAPLRAVHVAIPAVHIAACTALLVRPSLAVGALAFTLFKALDYSLFRAAKEMLYIPLSYDSRYRAKSVIDAFGYRLSKGAVSGVLALAGVVVGALPGGLYATVAIAASGCWVALAVGVTRRTGKS